MGRPLSEDAQGILDTMVDTSRTKSWRSTWSKNCGWYWDTPSNTKRLLVQLEKRGCVEQLIEGTFSVTADWWNNLLDSVYDLNTPLDGHYPDVYARRLGTSPQRDRVYSSTNLRCSCGWKPGTGLSGSKVSNESPGKGGRAIAKRAYQRHIHEVLAP